MRTRVTVMSSIGLVAALAATATPATGAEPRPSVRSYEMRAPVPPSHRVGAAAQLVSATATFSSRGVAGMPAAGSRPDQQLLPGARVDISYGYHWETDTLTYHFEARPVSAGLRPDDQPLDYVGIGLGVFTGQSCTIDTIDLDDTSRFSAEHLVYGAGDATGSPNAGLWNCAALIVQNGAGTATYDAWVSPLTTTTAVPQLSVRTPKRDRLVKNVWTRIPVKVANASPEEISARDVRVVGAGKGVKVRPASFGALPGEDDTEGHVWARLTRPRATLRLAVTEKGEALGRTTVKLRQRPAPIPPRAGSWSAPGVDFVVRGGKVRGFRIATQTTCGGYPGIPTTTNNNYDFPTVAIPRNNEVVGADRGNQGGDAAYSVYLELEFVSPTRAKGSFSYFGPARCRAIDGFTAKLGR